MTSNISTLLLLTASFLGAQTSFEVIHKKTAWPNGKGEIHITDDAIEFRAKKEKNSRTWAYRDIQHLDRLSPTEFVLLTYRDVGWQFGRDKQFRFSLTSGEITGELFEQISGRIGRPVTDRVVDNAPAEGRRLPVKHRHAAGGCEGELVFSEDTVSYVTDRKKHAREWSLDRDIDSVWAANRYQLEFHVYDNNRHEFSKTRVYRFDLKEPFDPDFYHELKLKLYNLRAGKRFRR